MRFASTFPRADWSIITLLVVECMPSITMKHAKQSLYLAVDGLRRVEGFWRKVRDFNRLRRRRRSGKCFLGNCPRQFRRLHSHSELHTFHPLGYFSHLLISCLPPTEMGTNCRILNDVALGSDLGTHVVPAMAFLNISMQPLVSMIIQCTLHTG